MMISMIAIGSMINANWIIRLTIAVIVEITGLSNGSTVMSKAARYVESELVIIP